MDDSWVLVEKPNSPEFEIIILSNEEKNKEPTDLIKCESFEMSANKLSYKNVCDTATNSPDDDQLYFGKYNFEFLGDFRL